MAQVRHLFHYLSGSFSVVSCFLNKASLYYKGHWQPNKAQQHAVLCTKLALESLFTGWAALGRQSQVSLWIQGHSGLQSPRTAGRLHIKPVLEVGGEEERKSDHTGKKRFPCSRLVCHLKTLVQQFSNCGSRSLWRSNNSFRGVT